MDQYPTPEFGMVVEPCKSLPEGLYIGDRVELVHSNNLATVISWKEAQEEHKNETGWDYSKSAVYIRYDYDEYREYHCWGILREDLIMLSRPVKKETNGQLLMF